MNKGALATFMRLVALAPRARLTLLAALMVLVSLTEGAGILLLVTLVTLIDSGAADERPARALGSVLHMAGLPVTLGTVLGLFVTIVALRSLIQFLREQTGVRLERGVVDDLRLRAYRSLTQAEWHWLANRRRSDHAHVLLANIDRVGYALTYGIALAAVVVTLAAFGLAALWLSPVMTVIVALNAAIVFVLLSVQRRRAVALGVRLSETQQTLFASVEQGLAGIRITRILGNGDRLLQRFARDLADLRTQALAYSTSVNLSRALFQLGAASLLAFYLYLGLTAWQVPLPELVALILLFARAMPMLMNVQQNSFQLLHCLPAAHQVEGLLEETERAAEPVSASELLALRLEHELRLEDVTVTWPERDQPSLEHVSLTVPARTTLAVIGPSGAGKSTLADVVMGLLAPDSGKVIVDGGDVTGADRIAWRNTIAYVPQDVFLFNDTVRANLAWGLPGTAVVEDSEAELRSALARAGAAFVFDLPQGLDTPVGDGGVRLSGGERQRIALARALLRQPTLLILDEATSALDPDNEARIRDAVAGLHGDLTVIVIGHRLSMVEQADQVVRLEHGRIAARGTWREVIGPSAAEPER